MKLKDLKVGETVFLTSEFHATLGAGCNTVVQRSSENGVLFVEAGGRQFFLAENVDRFGRITGLLRDPLGFGRIPTPSLGHTTGYQWRFYDSPQVTKLGGWMYRKVTGLFDRLTRKHA